MSMMLSDVRSAAVSRASVRGACADEFLEYGSTKLEFRSLVMVIAGVMAVLAVVRLLNLYAGGGAF